MVRDSKGSYDGWFWGWYGWAGSGWTGRLAGASGEPLPGDGLRPVLHQLPRVGERQLDLRVAEQHRGEPGEPLVFLSQNFFLDPSWQSLQNRIQNAGAKDAAKAGKDPDYNPAFPSTFSVDRRTAAAAHETRWR